MSKFILTLTTSMLVIATAMISVVLPSPFLLMEPGPALEVGPMISVPDSYRSEDGSIYLTSVSIRSATLAQWGMATLDPTIRLVPRDDVEPQDISNEDFRRIQLELLDESKAVAKIVALQELGYQVEISGEGARVEIVMPDSPANGRLEPGDTIVGVNGREMRTATELIEAVRKLQPGENVALTVLRGDQKLEIQSETMESTSSPGQTILGLLITTELFDFNLPVEVHIDTENLAGPSAGLMFTLGIIDALSPEDLTKGHRVAGTGTIAIDGTVGKIDGIKQKVIGAERAGAEYFLSPEENFADASGAARKITVVPVRTVDDALSFLSRLEETKKSEAPASMQSSMVLVPAQ